MLSFEEQRIDQLEAQLAAAKLHAEEWERDSLTWKSNCAAANERLRDSEARVAALESHWREIQYEAAHRTATDSRLWPTAAPIEAWRSSNFGVSVYAEAGGAERISVARAAINVFSGRWVDDIAWEDLMQIKNEIGRGDKWAVELFPPDKEIVNGANMRHLWILPEPPPYGWRNK